MTSDRIKEIQQTTAYPESRSVKQALLQVWNECGQENKYSEEEVLNILKARDIEKGIYLGRDEVEEWFNQFKK